ncbi:ComF family protein [Streptococcus uberis]|uniref:ComF family protein n=1 Tax=Streptococcus uberis TaxID=1349 RepID=UPI000DFB0BEE|nr:ComF family protein [Streptococcus uberis]SUO88871.1 late competence protein [Streptococcus uberis]
MDNSCHICNQWIEQDLSLLEILCFQQKESFLCKDCERALQPIKSQFCPRCYKVGEESICHDCLKWSEKGYQVNHRALYVYNDKMKDYFAKYKFQGDYILKSVFSKKLAKIIKYDYKGYVLVPVPISQKRYYERGYNQVEEILKSEKLTYTDLVLKREGKRHSHLNKREREQSENPFYLNKIEKTIPENILIVDDIYTTGSTIYHIYSLLEKAGCQKIKSISIAR